MSSSDIIKILSVTDTRTYEEGPDDRWYPVPNSGTENECARCGKAHVIHARVELRDGSVAVVGTTCADRGSLLFKQLRSAASRAKRRAKLEAQLATAESRLRSYQAAAAAVDELPVPPITADQETRLSERQYAIRCGDAIVWTFADVGLDEERRRCALKSWKRKRLAEAGADPNGRLYADRVKELRRQLDKLAA